ncbi:hypothetical protein ACJX0J_030224, partial [Zea mays]
LEKAESLCVAHQVLDGQPEPETIVVFVVFESDSVLPSVDVSSLLRCTILVLIYW